MALFQSHFNASVLLPNNAYRSTARSLCTSKHFSGDTSSLRFGWQTSVFRRQKHCRGNTCYTKAALNHGTLQWVSTVATAGRYGTWAAFIVLLVRLFYFIPGELELPFLTLLLVISAPYEAIDLR
ncbi:cold-regulated 413 inner membrane protein 1, chloroplastic-like isoform X2 [Dendrobium catenatum]|uniref:cold-regulated 413 inner membrane protein 1, chloroplastic-like isoform X2 n=1 Tax=Dendrobium catenatum TaxID=906689 RepID=UPI00109FD49D|nr:cold-regulated 413 inner membrane protein 1, chloroplastic-like isoform X2 [Dendrobium catenatum]